MLLDFSLAAPSERDITAGTRGYLDPFLDTPRRPVFDDHAERYAAAVTLHEMASTARPVWGDGTTDPRTTTDESPELAAELFEPALRDELTEFFRRAFHRDTDERFESVRQMEEAWRGVFVAADAASPVTTPETVGLAKETLEEEREALARTAAGNPENCVEAEATDDGRWLRDAKDRSRPAQYFTPGEWARRLQQRHRPATYGHGRSTRAIVDV